MSLINNSTIHPKSPNKPGRHDPLEPVYSPDWDDLEKRARIMATYWQHVIELAKIEQVLENLGEREIA